MEDENNMIDSEFDRYSQRSFRSTSTVQRTKYHTVSNDYTECTKPSAPTPVPNLNRSTIRMYFFFQAKWDLNFFNFVRKKN